MKNNYGLMNQGKNMLSKQGLKLTYYTHVYSHMTYCISVWSSMANEQQITKIWTQQNKCIHLFEPKSSLSNTYKNYGIIGIDHVIDLELCKLGYKLTK